MLMHLKDLVDILVQKKQRSINKTLIGTPKLLPYGSYSQGTSQNVDDVDVQLCCPDWIDIEIDFFGTFVSLISENSNFTSVIPIKKTIAPIIKLEYGKLNMDQAFCSASFDLSIVDSEFEKTLNDNRLLLQIEEKSIRAYNAWRNGHLILNSIKETINERTSNFQNNYNMFNDKIPDINEGTLNDNTAQNFITNIPNLEPEERLNNFRIAVKVLKLWAMRRGIYSNILGYLGGMSLAIQAAKISQMFPNYGPTKQIERFFFIYQFFPWNDTPQRIVKECTNLDLMECLKSSKGYFKRDDINNSLSNKKTQNIITPAFPEMNCAYSITDSQEKIVTKNIIEAFKIVRLIQENEIQWYHILFFFG